MKYTVLFHCEDPEVNYDLCSYTKEFTRLDIALETFNAKLSEKDSLSNGISHVEIDGPDINKVRKNPDYVSQPETECSEGAMQAGMAFGCQGYNDYMGW